MPKIAKKRHLVSAKRAAEILGVSRETLRKWGDQGPPKVSIPTGKRRYYSIDVLAQWVKSRSYA